ncbi:hypothetical protein C8R47DRAFT_1144421 [Mycena vitilis]|nr:hypothetical protein C8R47DRAFT_1144421 [Mycena vitilis]
MAAALDVDDDKKKRDRPSFLASPIPNQTLAAILTRIFASTDPHDIALKTAPVSIPGDASGRRWWRTLVARRGCPMPRIFVFSVGMGCMHKTFARSHFDSGVAVTAYLSTSPKTRSSKPGSQMRIHGDHPRHRRIHGRRVSLFSFPFYLILFFLSRSGDARGANERGYGDVVRRFVILRSAGRRGRSSWDRIRARPPSSSFFFSRFLIIPRAEKGPRGSSPCDEESGRADAACARAFTETRRFQEAGARVL